MDIPSIPKLILKFSEGTRKIVNWNWKSFIDLSNKSNKIKDKMNEILDDINTISWTSFIFLKGYTKYIIKIVNKGSNKIAINKFINN